MLHAIRMINAVRRVTSSMARQSHLRLKNAPRTKAPTAPQIRAQIARVVTPPIARQHEQENPRVAENSSFEHSLTVGVKK